MRSRGDELEAFVISRAINTILSAILTRRLLLVALFDVSLRARYRLITDDREDCEPLPSASRTSRNQCYEVCRPFLELPIGLKKKASPKAFISQYCAKKWHCFEVAVLPVQLLKDGEIRDFSVVSLIIRHKNSPFLRIARLRPPIRLGS